MKIDYLAQSQAPILAPQTPPLWSFRTREELEDIPRVSEMLSRAISTSKPYKFRQMRLALLQLPSRTLAFAAADAIKGTKESRSFDRLAKLLAEIGGDIALGTLAAQAFSQKRFPRLAARALAMCDHPSVVPALLELVSKGNMKQCRAAARYLLVYQGGRGVEPLCKLFKEHKAKAGIAVAQAFHEIGGANRLSMLLLGDRTMDPPSRVNGIQAIEGIFRFDGLRFLERQSRGWFTHHKAEALEALEVLRQRKMLLRPSEAGQDILLRAAGGPSNINPNELLRASENGQVEMPRRTKLLERLAALVSRIEA